MAQRLRPPAPQRGRWKDARCLCFQGDTGQRGPTGEPGVPGAQVAAQNHQLRLRLQVHTGDGGAVGVCFCAFLRATEVLLESEELQEPKGTL